MYDPRRSQETKETQPPSKSHPEINSRTALQIQEAGCDVFWGRYSSRGCRDNKDQLCMIRHPYICTYLDNEVQKTNWKYPLVRCIDCTILSQGERGLMITSNENHPHHRR